jgi:hypothetical protein
MSRREIAIATIAASMGALVAFTATFIATRPGPREAIRTQARPEKPPRLTREQRLAAEYASAAMEIADAADAHLTGLIAQEAAHSRPGVGNGPEIERFQAFILKLSRGEPVQVPIKQEYMPDSVFFGAWWKRLSREAKNAWAIRCVPAIESGQINGAIQATFLEEWGGIDEITALHLRAVVSGSAKATTTSRPKKYPK